MKKTIVESNCFTDELLSCTPKLSSTGGVELGSHFISTSYGRIVSAAWNSDGALVCVDEHGNKHFFVGTQKEFLAFGDQKTPNDSNGYLSAIKENKALRNQSDDDYDDDEDEEEAKEERKRSKKQSKSSCGFCSVCKCLLKTVLNLICLGALIDSMDD